MRQIKFRAWDIDANKMVCVWEMQFPLPNDERSLNGGGKYVYQQFTGLKDKNEREIYEGDIVRAGYFTDFDDKSKRKWHKYVGEITCEHMSWLKCGEKNWNELITIHAEIIGNVYENPELLNNPHE